MDYQNREKNQTNYVLTFNAVIENDCIYIPVYPRWRPLPLEIIFKNQKEFQLSRKLKSKTRTTYNDILK
jgi:hypothetical protein